MGAGVEHPGALGRSLHTGLVRTSTISPRSLFSWAFSPRGPSCGRRILAFQMLMITSCVSGRHGHRGLRIEVRLEGGACLRRELCSKFGGVGYGLLVERGGCFQSRMSEDSGSAAETNEAGLENGNQSTAVEGDAASDEEQGGPRTPCSGPRFDLHKLVHAAHAAHAADTEPDLAGRVCGFSRHCVAVLCAPCPAMDVLLVSEGPPC